MSQSSRVPAEVPRAEIKDSSPKSTINVSIAAGPKLLPFEFRALEACLESACRALESEVCIFQWINHDIFMKHLKIEISSLL